MKHCLLIFILLLNTACSLTTAKTESARHDFGITTASTFKPTDISITTADWLNNDCIHYRLLYASPTQLSCYSLDKWIAPPTELLKQRLSHSLSTKYRLTVELVEFEQQFDSPNNAKVVLQLIVHAYKGQAEQPIATQSFHFQQTTAPNATGAVTGFTNLIRQASDKIQTWLTGLATQPLS
jgi:cholesterol transport system auxiliary component